jgi:hypothetical protein
MSMVVLYLAVLFVPGAKAQEIEQHPTPGQIYCSGLLTSTPISQESYMITGEESDTKIAFDQGDYVYINRGAAQGAREGEEFLVIRAIDNPMYINWYHWQSFDIRALGKVWEDEGRIRVVKALANVSIAQIEESCDYMQRGDIVQSFEERPSPAIQPASHFERFAAPEGGPEGRVVMGKSFDITLGMNSIAYVNLGQAEGVNVGDYLRFVRYPERTHEVLYQTSDMTFRVEGFGSAPGRHSWQNVPREVLGEGVVLRTGPQSASVLITFSLREIEAGDFVEVEKE